MEAVADVWLLEDNITKVVYALVVHIVVLFLDISTL
jgi:hypothetical protein